MIAEAMVLTGPRNLERRRMTIPDVGDRGAILRVEACGLCGTDHEQFTGHLPAGFSFVPGHEIVGIVERVGAAAGERWGVQAGQRVAVLAVDPSSPVTGGSILGDKTRMEQLAVHENAFIRPSPSGGSLGGVAQRTREAMIVCEAAGFDVVLVETVGIGQSEVAVSSMVDFFLVLLQPGGGDELQGIKKGVLELADALVVNKADGDTQQAAERTRASYAGALDLVRSPGSAWQPRVQTASALEGVGVSEIWETVIAHRKQCEANGSLQTRRCSQARAWMWSLVEEGLERRFRSHPLVQRSIPDLEEDVEALKMTPAAAARALLEAFNRG